MHDKTSYFIPSGYDRFSILKSNDTLHDIDVDYYEMIKDEEKILASSNKKEEEEVVCDKVSDFLKNIKDRVYRSRKSMIREDIKNKKENEESIKKIEDNSSEKVNKFDVFLKKKEGEPEKPNLSKEERAKKTRENIMHKLNIKKNKNSSNN